MATSLYQNIILFWIECKLNLNPESDLAKISSVKMLNSIPVSDLMDRNQTIWSIFQLENLSSMLVFSRFFGIKSPANNDSMLSTRKISAGEFRYLLIDWNFSNLISNYSTWTKMHENQSLRANPSSEYIATGHFNEMTMVKM